MFCFSVSVALRYQQFDSWEKTRAFYFVGERPMMTTLDAPFWLRLSREYNEGTYGQKEFLRSYPEATQTFQEISVKELSIPQNYIDTTPKSDSFLSSSRAPEIRYNEVPLLSFLIAKISPYFNHNYYLTGTMLIPVLASLFILPLGIFFFIIGAPVSGLMGGLIGTFASGYYMRSSIGRIDTDMLNLFFPVMIALLIFQASRAKTERAVLLFSIGAGLFLFIFNWWYNKPGFALVYFVILVSILFIQQKRFRTILLSALLFMLCMYPGIFLNSSGSILGFLLDYRIFEDVDKSSVTNIVSATASFPNVMKTISEVDHVSLGKVLSRVLSNTFFSWVGILVFFGLAMFRWKAMLPLAPMLLLGLMSFQSSNRFIMYLGPFIGIGLGFLFSLLVEGVFVFRPWKTKESIEHKTSPTNSTKSIKEKKVQSIKVTEFENSTFINWLRQGVLYFGMGVFFWLISSQTAISYVPGPSIHPQLYATFLEVKERVPKGSALLTWWDFGYAITDATGLATFHDGGSQFSPKTFFTARGLISSDQDELYDISQFLATEGTPGIIKNNISPKDLLNSMRNPEHKPWDPIYIFFTADMTMKFGAISSLGSWDIVNGGSKPKFYQKLACNKFTKEGMSCRGAKIDLKAGDINGNVPLRRIVFIREGQVLSEQKFGHTQGYSLQLLVSGRQIVEVQLIEEEVFQSNYNQMFFLGRYHKDLFEESYNAFPISRLYRIKF